MAALPRVLAVGAFERDNFGDTLFLHVTREFTPSVSLHPASIFASTLVDGEEVANYAESLSTQDWDGVLVVGGEVGDVRMDGALRMSLAGQELRDFMLGDDAYREGVATSFGHASLQSSAYVPRIADYTAAPIPLWLHSVGLANGLHHPDEAIREQFATLVRNAKSVSVRDRRSFAGYSPDMPHVRLRPDAVHAISQTRRFALEGLPYVADGGYVVVQIRADSIREGGLDYTAGALAELSRHHSIAFLAAGTAGGHDNIGLYYALGERLKALPGTRPVTILTSRDTPSIVGAIARSTAWIGTSLHGRIVASSYDLPRVSLQNPKVTEYAHSWESAYPADVPIRRALEAIEFAIAHHKDRAERKRTDGLVDMAIEGLALLNKEMQ